MIKKILIIGILFFLYNIVYGQKINCEKIIVNKVEYVCGYDGIWSLDFDNLATIEVRQLTNGESVKAFWTKDYISYQFYEEIILPYSNIQKLPTKGKFRLHDYKIKINNKTSKQEFLYGDILDLNYDEITFFRIKNNRIVIKTTSL